MRRIALLARIEITPSEAEAVHAQLNDIFGLIEQLQAVDTRGVEPMSHAGDNALRLRDDVVTDTNLRDRYQAVAPKVEGGLYLVPKVIE